MARWGEWASGPGSAWLRLLEGTAKPLDRETWGRPTRENRAAEADLAAKLGLPGPPPRPT